MDETSLEIVNAGEMYPKQSFTSDDGILSVPFTLLSGESPVYRGPSAEGIIIVTSYRLYQSEGPYINIPLGLVDCIEVRDILYLYIYCKDGRFFRCIFESAEEVQKWTKRFQSRIQLPQKIDACFAFRFLSWMREEQKDNIVSQSNSNFGDIAADCTYAEAERMGFDLKSVWKISTINENYDLCPSYPRYIITPSILLDKEIKDLSNFRYSNRIPAVVWRHQQNGCVIARSSQPRQGVWCWRNEFDEKLLDAISAACLMDPGYGDPRLSDEDTVIKNEVDSDISILYQGQDNKRKKLLIIDARSYAAAVTNRAKGGGYECDGYYPHCEVQYMGLANIHAIRSSFHSVRSLCVAPDDASWLSALEGTKWLLHISGLLRAALLVVDAVDVERRPVLVHCSDGWDRTPQIVALAEIMLDPFYRTKKGFQILVEREWLEFGHKFADRCGHPDGTDDRNERSPVFLQWLDCVFQLTQQFPCHFEFNEHYLARLVLHTYSCLFGTFLCNTDQDRRLKYSIYHRTFSVWPVLNEKGHFRNYLYNHSTEVLRPSFQIRNIEFWSEVYFPNNSANLGKSTMMTPDEQPPDIKPPIPVGEKTNLVKTKSCDNIHSPDHSMVLQRRRSDPNLVENNFPEKVEGSFPEKVSVPKPTIASEPVKTDSESVEIDHFSENSYTVVTENDKKDVECCLEELCDISLCDERTDAKNSNLVLRQAAIDGSTDTLVSECGATIQHQGDTDGIEMQIIKRSLVSVATDTSDLLLETKISKELEPCKPNSRPNWYQEAVGAYMSGAKRNCGSCSCSYTTPNHSRTPSSGFPATPCDDPGDMPNLKKDPASQIMDFDGLDFQSHAVQERLRKLILHYKNKVVSINQELQYAKEELFQRIYSCPHSKEGCFLEPEDTPSLAGSASSGDQPERESAGSESSWDLMGWTPDQGACAPNPGV